MIELLKAHISKGSNKQHQLNLLREFLQVLTLKILADDQFFRSAAFIGGTALRILYDVRRYSEDLDFSVTAAKHYDFDRSIANISQELKLRSLLVDLRTKKGTIDSCLISFKDLLLQLNLSRHANEKLSIKLEIDTNPPKGGELTDSVVNKEFIFPVRHYDLPSLMAGKLHAVLCRRFVKGRDFYDLLWYLSKSIEPNLKLLRNSIRQTESSPDSSPTDDWKGLLRTRISSLDFRKIRQDLEPFIEDETELQLITEGELLKLL